MSSQYDELLTRTGDRLLIRAGDGLLLRPTTVAPVQTLKRRPKMGVLPINLTDKGRFDDAPFQGRISKALSVGKRGGRRG